MTNAHSAPLSVIQAYVDDLETRLSAARAGFLDNLDNANLGTISDISNLTATEIAYLDAKISEVVKQVALTGHPGDSIGKILYDIYTTRLTVGRAANLDNINNANLATIANISTLTAAKIAHLDADISSVGLDRDVLLDAVSAGYLTVLILQAVNAYNTGTSTDPLNATDNNASTYNNFTLNQTTIFNLEKVHTLFQWRQYGYPDCTGDGTYRIDYWDGDSWVEWTTFSTSTTDGFDSWVEVSEISTKKLRITATAIDTKGYNSIREIEIKF